MPFLFETVATADAPGRLRLRCEKCISPDGMHNEGGDFQDLDSQTQTDLPSLLEIWKRTNKIWKNGNKYSSFSFFHSGSYREICGTLCTGSHIVKCVYERERECGSILCIHVCISVAVIVCERVCEYMSVRECVYECLSIFKSMLYIDMCVWEYVWMCTHLCTNRGWDIYFFWKQVKRL